MQISFASIKDKDWRSLRFNYGLDRESRWKLEDYRGQYGSGSDEESPSCKRDIQDAIEKLLARAYCTGTGETITMKVSGHDEQFTEEQNAVNPNWLYLGRRSDECTYCGRSPTKVEQARGVFRKCVDCEDTPYCSDEHMYKDYKVHKGLCKKRKRVD